MTTKFVADVVVGKESPSMNLFHARRDEKNRRFVSWGSR